MITKALFAELKAKPGKEKEVEEFLKSALPIVQGEKGTITWYAVKFNDSTFGIFDTFGSEEDRQLHLTGDVANALMSKASELFSEDPNIRLSDVLASK